VKELVKLKPDVKETGNKNKVKIVGKINLKLLLSEKIYVCPSRASLSRKKKVKNMHLKIRKRVGGMAQVVECLPCRCKALSSNPTLLLWN
jgi:hypothetical protein